MSTYQLYDKITRESIVKREKNLNRTNEWSNGHISKELTLLNIFSHQKNAFVLLSSKTFPKNPEFIGNI